MKQSSKELRLFSDEELAQESQAGSVAAFEELVLRYERRIYAFVAQSCRNGMDAGEITQETFVKAFQAIGQFEPRCTFAAWLFTIARRKCIDHYRASPPIAEEPVPDLAGAEDPGELLALKEERQNLWQLARQVLPEGQFQALWLRYAEEMSVAEVARVLRKTKTHAKVLLFRARQALGRQLESRAAVERASRPAASPCPAHPPSRIARHETRNTQQSYEILVCQVQNLRRS